MAQEHPPIDYQTVCRYVGQLFLESRATIDEAIRQRQKAEVERDAALEAFMKPKE